MADNRHRNFASVIYPESAPSDFMDILSSHFVPAFVSPLHDNDINPTGEKKKEHYHVIIMFDGKKTEEQAREVLESIGGVGCEVVKSIRGYARYLCHLDNPDKYRYDVSYVRSFCGADYASCIGLTIDKYIAIEEMVDWCEENDIVSYYDLFLYARKERKDWFRCLCDSSTMVMKEYLKSRKWSQDRGIIKACEVFVDMETGEIIDC